MKLCVNILDLVIQKLKLCASISVQVALRVKPLALVTSGHRELVLVKTWVVLKMGQWFCHPASPGIGSGVAAMATLVQGRNYDTVP